MIQNEVMEFINITHAIPKKLKGYNGNLFIKDGIILIIKVSRTDKKFYGANGNILDTLIYALEENSIHFGIVLLNNEQGGWFYPDNIIFNKIQRGIWRKANDGDYKINFPFTDSFYFNSYDDFEGIFKMLI